LMRQPNEIEGSLVTRKEQNEGCGSAVERLV